MSNPWVDDPSIATQQRKLVDQQLQEIPPPQHFAAFASAIRDTKCPGELLEVGCGVGHGREILDRAGIGYNVYRGVDISTVAIALAKARYPESLWLVGDTCADLPLSKSDIVVDAACLMHIDDWKAHLATLCRASSRHVILHRVPIAETTEHLKLEGYGHELPAWRFAVKDIVDEMALHGFVPQLVYETGTVHCHTFSFAKARHYVSYCDSAYLSRLKALHASMVRHCSPFVLHVLAWDYGVAEWCIENKIDYTHVEDFTAAHTELWRDKLPGPPRTNVEYMWTVGPSFLAATVEKYGEPATYVDSDILFHSSPEPVFAEIGDWLAAVVPHGFADAGKGLPGPTDQTHWVFGKYNCGFVYVADSRIAKRWADRCVQWCFDKVDVDAGLYADQRYLEEWVHSGMANVIKNPAACPGPWGVHAHSLDVRNGVIHFGNRPLVAWHYSSYKELPHGMEQITRPEYALTDRQASILYTPYRAALKEAK